MPDLVETLMSVTTSPESLLLFAAGAITAISLMLPIVLRGAGGQRGGSSYTPKPVKLSGDEKKDFLVVFEALTSEVLDEVEQYNLPPRTRDYMRRMAEYNVPKGKLTRGLTVISALKEIKYGGKALPAAEYQRAATLGWCVEWLQAMFLVMDDIMDESETRRGQICWYLQPDVKMNAINDGLLLEAQIYVILKKYFGSDPVYIHLLELLHEVTHQTALGQVSVTRSRSRKPFFFFAARRSRGASCSLRHSSSTSPPPSPTRSTSRASACRSTPTSSCTRPPSTRSTCRAPSACASPA